MIGLWDRGFAWLRAFFGEPLVRSLRRRLRAASPAALMELREGLHCRIVGTVGVHDNQTLEAPLTGVRCVAYLLEVIQTSVGNERELLVYTKAGVPFVLSDGDHRAIVDPAFCELLTRDQYEVRARSAHGLDTRSLAVLKRYVTKRTWSGTTGLRLREIAIEPGARVSIAGTGHVEADPLALRERGYREEGQQRLRFAGEVKLPLLIGDDPP